MASSISFGKSDLILMEVSKNQIEQNFFGPNITVKSVGCPNCYVTFDQLTRYTDSDKTSFHTGVRDSFPVQVIPLNSESVGSREDVAVVKNIKSTTYFNFILCRDYSDKYCERLDPNYEFTWFTSTGEFVSTIPRAK